MCGIAGICLGAVSTAALPELLEASLLLQHRGQDACGIATHDRDGNPAVHKNYGLVTEVFAEAEPGLQNLSGSMGIVHGNFPFHLMMHKSLAKFLPTQSDTARPVEVHWQKYSLCRIWLDPTLCFAM